MGTIYEASTGLRAALLARSVVFELAFTLSVAVVLTMTGTFGLFLHDGWPARLAYWTRTVLAGYLLHRPLLRLFAGAAVRLGLPELAGWTASVLVASAPMALWLWWLGPSIDLGRRWPDAAEFAGAWAQAAIIAALAFGALWGLAGRWSFAEPTPRAAPEVAREPPAPVGAPLAAPAEASLAGQRLLERLPARLGREVIALGMEDHYVRVFTRLGDALVLMRMTDAVAELDGVEGLQVHRSWWVARAAIVAIERCGRTGVLTLETGFQLPVARRRIADLKRLGWIASC